ncbi:tetratricopeptide repeat protein [Lacibacterium aquatile]|uniref:Tetratricopeptide repeat protein n=1 Tax=Lacibacterium aquatile TaxID=1168082 RepID=A0ABW5DNB2_9PROT
MILIPLLAAGCISGSAVAAGIDQSAQYQACMALISRSPMEASESARTWAERGGGIPARHCLARALIGLKKPKEAADELEGLIKLVPEDRKDLVPDLMGQAALAWVEVGDLQRAFALQSEALKRRPGDMDLLTDRAITLGQSGHYWEAIDDLNLVLQRAPRRVDALVYRATAYRYVDELELGLEDAEKAVGADPRNLAALLERGIQRRLKGDDAGARSDWMALLRIAPNAAESEAARANLEKLDVKPR